MLGIAFRSLVRRSEVSASKPFGSLNDCFKLFETNNSVPTQELYDAFKYLASDNTVRKDAIKDERYPSILNQLDTRLSTLNSSYLGNFALRLVLLSQSNNYLGTNRNDVNVEQTKKVIEKIATTMIDKGGHVKEISQVAYAASSLGVVNHPIFDYEKQQLTLNIDLATPDSLNLSLQTAYKRGTRDRVYLALLCEKLSELTDRFTANDVVMTLRSLSKTGLLKGFLLRRLFTLMMDNLDQFSESQLIQCSYRLATLKFFTSNNFKTVFNILKPKLEDLPFHLKVELLAASYLSNVETDNEDMLNFLDSIKLDQDYDLLNLADYVYASAYYKRYGDRLQKAVSSMFSKTPFIARKYALLAKEALDSISLESKLKINMPDAWKEALDNFEKTEIERMENQPIYQESKKILESTGKFKYLQKVGPYLVSFVDDERKLCIDVEYGTLISNLSLKLRNLNALGYKASVVRYWEWRRLKTEKNELKYAFRLYDKDCDGKLSFNTFKTLIKSIGIHLTKGELEFLEYEESVRGGFTLENLYALGESFYTNSVIKEKVVESLKEHFNNSTYLDKFELKKVLIKLGNHLRASEQEIESFFKFYINDEVSKNFTVERFVDE
uniref:EF hand/EF-hand domain containing protein, putative n=1 Tax=Theileria annulata TaxID=5874 RepID=A0A3B0N689_THEAN